MDDVQDTSPDGKGVLFYCLRGKHRSAAAVACYILRSMPQLSPEDAMAEIQERSRAARGNKSAARFHEQGAAGDFPPLAPLVRAMATLRVGPRLLEG